MRRAADTLYYPPSFPPAPALGIGIGCVDPLDYHYDYIASTPHHDAKDLYPLPLPLAPLTSWQEEIFSFCNPQALDPSDCPCSSSSSSSSSSSWTYSTSSSPSPPANGCCYAAAAAAPATKIEPTSDCTPSQSHLLGVTALQAQRTQHTNAFLPLLFLDADAQSQSDAATSKHQQQQHDRDYSFLTSAYDFDMSSSSNMASNMDTNLQVQAQAQVGAAPSSSAIPVESTSSSTLAMPSTSTATTNNNNNTALAPISQQLQLTEQQLNAQEYQFQMHSQPAFSMVRAAPLSAPRPQQQQQIHSQHQQQLHQSQQVHHSQQQQQQQMQNQQQQYYPRQQPSSANRQSYSSTTPTSSTQPYRSPSSYDQQQQQQQHMEIPSFETPAGTYFFVARRSTSLSPPPVLAPVLTSAIDPSLGTNTGSNGNGASSSHYTNSALAGFGRGYSTHASQQQQSLASRLQKREETATTVISRSGRQSRKPAHILQDAGSAADEEEDADDIDAEADVDYHMSEEELALIKANGGSVSAFAAQPAASKSLKRSASAAGESTKPKKVARRLADSSTAQQGAKRFTCTFDGCGKAFARAFNCQSHEKSHNGIREFPCQYCDKQFSRRHDRTRHCTSVHLALMPEGIAAAVAESDHEDALATPPKPSTAVAAIIAGPSTSILVSAVAAVEQQDNIVVDDLDTNT